MKDNTEPTAQLQRKSSSKRHLRVDPEKVLEFRELLKKERQDRRHAKLDPEEITKFRQMLQTEEEKNLSSREK